MLMLHCCGADLVSMVPQSFSLCYLERKLALLYAWEWWLRIGVVIREPGHLEDTSG